MVMDNSDVFEGLAAEAQVKVSILYFARLREVLATEREELWLPAGATVGTLREHLRRRGGAWETELAVSKPVRIAVNQDMAKSETVLQPGDEVALFPPVTGG